MRFIVDCSKRNSSCKKCKKKMESGSLRLAKVTPNPFSENADDMKQYYHPDCLFDSFKTLRTTNVIESSEDIEGWAELEDDDKAHFLQKISEISEARKKKIKTSPAKGPAKSKADIHGSPAKRVKPPDNQQTLEAAFGHKGERMAPNEHTTGHSNSALEHTSLVKDASELNPVVDHIEGDPTNEDNSWSHFCDLCESVGAVSSYKQKTAVVKTFFKDGSLGGKQDGFKGDVYLFCKLLLPGVIKRVYNINSKQILKRFSQGDVSATVRYYFENNKKYLPLSKSALNLQDVDQWLEAMTQFTKDEDQSRHLLGITKKSTALDLMYIIRQLKHDLRINAGAKHILEALDPNAYTAFQASRDLRSVIGRLRNEPGQQLKADIRLGVPVLPMLAEPCRSVEYALRKCPNGMYAEVKYDGERVQVHKEGNEFHYFSRSLKPVLPHKVNENVLCEAYLAGSAYPHLPTHTQSPATPGKP